VWGIQSAFFIGGQGDKKKDGRIKSSAGGGGGEGGGGAGYGQRCGI